MQRENSQLFFMGKSICGVLLWQVVTAGIKKEKITEDMRFYRMAGLMEMLQ